MDQESLPALVSRFIQLRQNGAEAHGKCPFCADDGESLRVGDTWRCVACCEQEVNGADGIGWIMSWSGCSREEALTKLSNGESELPVFPIEIPPRRKLPFWGGPFLEKMPEARVWVHDDNAGVWKGREYYPSRVHLGIIYKADLADVSQLCQPKRECILLPRNIESSMERMDALAAALYAAGHAKVKWIDPRSQEDNWSWPLGMGKDEAVAFAKKNVRTYPNNAAPQELPAVTSASRAMKASESGYRSEELSSNAGEEPAGRRSTTDSLSRDSAQYPDGAAPSNAAPAPAPVSPSSSQGLDRGAASDSPKDSLGLRLERKRPGNGQGGPPLAPERADAYLEATRKEVLSSLIYVRVSDVRLKRLNWLWPAKIPRGMITMLQGDPKLGKSQICASIASIVSNSGQWPVTRERCEGGSVIILSSEDPLQELLGPRLVAAGADISKVIVLQMIQDPAKGARGFDLGLDIARLGVLIDEIADVKLVIIDPVSAYLGAVDSHKNAEVRGLLRPMEELIARKAVAMIFVNHLTKDATKKAMMRGQMSIAFSAVARAVWGVVVDDEAPEDSRRRLFLPVGVNMARDQAGLAYTIEGAQLDSPDGGEPIETSRIMWEAGEVTANIDAVSARSGYSHDERGSIAEARDFLAETLAEGRLTAKEVERLAKLAGHNLTTLGRAKRAMGIKSEKEGWANQTVWYWRL